MAAAKKKNPKNPTVKPMPVGKPKPIAGGGRVTTGDGHLNGRPWTGQAPARPPVGMTKPATVPGRIAPKPAGGSAKKKYGK